MAELGLSGSTTGQGSTTLATGDLGFREGSSTFKYQSDAINIRDYFDKYVIDPKFSVNIESVPISQPVTYFVMRGLDPDCITVTYRFWTVSGSPDLSGASYSGPKCGVSSLTDIVVVHRYTI